MSEEKLLSRLPSELPRRLWQRRRCYIMAVINATPDSFSADGLFAEAEPQTEPLATRLLRTVREGADVLDIGAESTRPGAQPIASEVQIARLTPVFSALRQIMGDQPEGWCVSLDTSDALVARWGLGQGVQMINDVRGGGDSALLDVVAEYGSEIVLMHNSSKSDSVERDPVSGASYIARCNKEIVPEVIDALSIRVVAAQRAGIAAGKIFLDPGIGFGKTIADNLRLIQATDQIAALGYPVLIGASRKSFLGKILNKAHDSRLEGSLMVHGQAWMCGAQMVRVHDVEAHHRLRQIAEALKHPEDHD